MAMAVGGTRMRPRMDRPSRTNASSISGGIFGTEHAFYSHLPDGKGGDFMSRLEQAEQRDARTLALIGDWADDRHVHDTSPYNPEALLYHRRVRHVQDRGAIQFGDDSPVQKGASRYQTTNGANQKLMQQSHERALAKHEEKILVDIMVDQHGMSEHEAKQEIEMYRREQAQQGIKQAPPQQQLRRGWQPPPAPAPQQSRDYDYYGGMQTTSHSAMPASPPVDPNRAPAGRGNIVNRSSISGGIFAPGPYS